MKLQLDDIIDDQGRFTSVTDLALAIASNYSDKDLNQENQSLVPNAAQLIIVNQVTDASYLHQLLNQFNVKNYYFPDREILPYDNYSTSKEIVAERLACLYQIRNLNQGIIITSVDAIMTKLCSQEYLDTHGLIIKTADKISIEILRKRLIEAGFMQTNQVHEKGEFAVRGSILDIFPPSSRLAIRVDFFDNEIDEIRIFDPKTQLSTTKIEVVDLIPNSEVDLSDNGRACFLKQIQAWLGDAAKSHLMYEKISNNYIVGGIESFLPLFFDKETDFFDYLPNNFSIISEQKTAQFAKAYFKKTQSRFAQVNVSTNDYLPPEKLYLDSDYLQQQIDKRNCRKQNIANKEITKEINSFKLQSYKFTGDIANRFAKLNDLIKKNGNVLIFAQSEGQLDIINNKLDNVLPNKSFIAWQFNGLAICVGGLQQSRQISSLTDNNKAFIICGRDLFDYQYYTPDDADSYNDNNMLADDLSLLEIGDAIVHFEHGVGRYKGLKTMQIGEETSEYITIAYANEQNLYIPITEMETLSKYQGASLDNAPLHNINGKQWDKAKQKAQEKIFDTATELLEIYAKRELAKSDAITIDEDDLAQFCEGFLFTPTVDQTKTFNAVYNDLTKTKPMDRIVCGDVGFGKTEVAMRAAFVVANAGKQVAILAPTTLLVEQHYKNFEDRFANFPLVIASLSRFKTDKEQNEVLTRLAAGKVDIVIGTHRLLSADIKFENLGLIIIDEEHKFGVRQKEQLKNMRTNVNILTLTATPIPRTLSMSLAGLRDLSIIASPPAKRSPVHTIFVDFDETKISEGIEREVGRGGQIYFLHNDIVSMPRIEAILNKLFPKLKIRHAHGQMPEKELEQIMLDFYHHHFDVLLSTTIIESGIDNPNANTIFINRADKFGLAQLHQLRGRVGRSHHQAYAYLITPHESILTDDAKKRIAAFSSLQGLGVGFMLASQDLEIRGAGELLGENQSGQIIEIGFSLYNELLEQTIDAIKNNKKVSFDKIGKEIEIDLASSLIIPDTYIYDTHQRLLTYKQIANCQDENSLDRLQIELIDKYGLLPQSAQNLFLASELKLFAKKYGLSKIVFDLDEDTENYEVTLTLTENNKFDIEKIVEAIKQSPLCYQLLSGNRLKIDLANKKKETVPVTVKINIAQHVKILVNKLMMFVG